MNSLVVCDKYIYCCSTYAIWKCGASLLEEKYYYSSKPLKSYHINKSNYKIYRFFELIRTPNN